MPCLISHDGLDRRDLPVHGLLTLPRTSPITLGKPTVVPGAAPVLLLLSTVIICTVQIQDLGVVTGGEGTQEVPPPVANSPVGVGTAHTTGAVDVGNSSNHLLPLPSFLELFRRAAVRALSLFQERRESLSMIFCLYFMAQ